MNDKQIMFAVIEKLVITTKNKEGEPLVDKNGKGYSRAGIKVAEFPNKWLSCLCYAPKGTYGPRKELEIVEGESHWLRVEQNGDFLNFKLASSIDVLEMKVEKLEKQVAYLYKNSKAEKPLITKKDLKTAEPQEFESEYIEKSEDEQLPF